MLCAKAQFYWCYSFDIYQIVVSSLWDCLTRVQCRRTVNFICGFKNFWSSKNSLIYITISFVGFKSTRSTLVPEISFNIQRCTYKRFFWHTKLKNERNFFFNTQSRCTSVVNFNLKHLLVNFLSPLLKKKFSKLVFLFSICRHMKQVQEWDEYRLKR